MYAIGSRNSSSVGLKVGASCKPCGLFLDEGSLDAGCPLRSTVFMSSGVAHRALFGKADEDMGGAEPFDRFGGAAFMLATALFGGAPPFVGTPVAGVATISATLTRSSQRQGRWFNKLIASDHEFQHSADDGDIGFGDRSCSG